jgi:hypothetical protein
MWQNAEGRQDGEKQRKGKSKYIVLTGLAFLTEATWRECIHQISTYLRETTVLPL